ncbi:MAG: glycoside hydrolase/phage tail family protein, partial [Hyphomicrobiaceae bacterium]
GGTPSDQTIVDQLRELQSRQLSVTLNPFILMDVAQGNTLPNPLGGSASQPAYPWRGRITCDPAPGRPGTADKTAAAAAQLASFIGTALPTHFALSGDNVIYSGPAEWSYRRFILHYAWLAKAAGNLSTFLIGSELRGLTTLRSNASTFPFVAALQQLAADVKTLLGPTVKVTYAADWSEYFGHQPTDGTGDVYFHLDPLWASTAIDAIGIDLYWPLADWRDGGDHLDQAAGIRSIHDLAYLKGNLTAGEGYDWYYDSDAARRTQSRTPITDSAGKPWVFRYKDLKSWWLNTHKHRPGGIESASTTAWVPQSKPVWFMEVGCGAVDKAANQPNAFVDGKSTESALPHFSTGRRDDLMQRRYLQALLEAFDPASPGAVAGLNPVSAVYGGRMVAIERTHVYAWDLRPYPAFPSDTATWGDGGNWRLGHWLNGRIASIGLDALVAQIMGDYAFDAFDATALAALVPGYVIDRIMAPRDALQPLELAFFFDSLESGGQIKLRHRGASDAVIIIDNDLAVELKPDVSPITLTRGQETDLPASAKISFVSSDGDYRQAVAEARRLTGASGRVAQADLPIILDPDAAAELSECWLFEAWASRERASFALPPSSLAIEPGDALVLNVAGKQRLVRVTEIGDHGTRTVEARALDPRVYARAAQPQRTAALPVIVPAGQPEVLLLDLPMLTGDEPEYAGYVVAAQSPWPGALAIYRSPDVTGFTLQGFVNATSALGVTLDPLPVGPEGRIDLATRLRVVLASGASVTSVARTKLLSGANVAVVRTPANDWEVLQFENAQLVAPNTYELSNLLRGQAGTESAMAAGPVAAGAPFVMLGTGLTRLDLAAGDIGLPLTWRIGPASQDLGSAHYLTTTHAFRGLGKRPLSPVHIRGTRSADDLAITWVRRTRSGGDSWTAAEVPLFEASEAYEIDIMDGATVKRSLAASIPRVIYTAAQQIADFGAPQASVLVRVCQMSAVWGRGATRSAVI